MVRSLAMLVLFLLVCFGAAGLGGLFTARSVGDWYPQLAKPAWTPDGAVISIVWNVLFTLMAVAAWRVWRRHRFAGAPAAFISFAGQLLLNVGWSALFFGLRSPGAALVELIALEAAILVTLVLFFRRDRLAGWLLTPYPVWVAFAGVLNLTIWRMN